MLGEIQNGEPTMTIQDRKIRIVSMAAMMFLTLGLLIAGCDEAPQQQSQSDRQQADESDRADHGEAPGTSDNENAEERDQVDEFPEVFRGELRELPEAPNSLDELPEGVNVVQYEMRLLTAALQNILQLIADERLDEIHDQIRQVHPVYELTHEAIDAGEYRPPVNPDAIERFEQMDDDFHDELRGLVGAANDGDLEGVTEQYGRIVDGCASCHGEFRFP